MQKGKFFILWLITMMLCASPAFAERKYTATDEPDPAAPSNYVLVTRTPATVWVFNRLFKDIDVRLHEIETGTGPGTADAEWDSEPEMETVWGFDILTTSGNDWTEAQLEAAISDMANILQATELDIFAELQALIADKTLVNEEDATSWDALATFKLGVTIETGDPLTLGSSRIDNGSDKLLRAAIEATTKYIPFKIRLGIPKTNLTVVDIRQGFDDTNMHEYVKRIAISGSDTASSIEVGVQLPADFDEFYQGGDNIFVYVYSSDRATNTITMSVYDDTGDVDGGVNNADIEPGSDGTWLEASDKITETDAAYAASKRVYIKIFVDLDSAAYYYIGEGYIIYTTS